VREKAVVVPTAKEVRRDDGNSHPFSIRKNAAVI